MMKSETKNVVSDVLGQEHLHAIIEQVEEMLMTTCHTVIKTLVKLGLLHNGHVRFVRNLIQLLGLLLERF